MKFAPTIAELVTADGVSAKDMTTSEVWLVRNTSSSEPRIEVSRYYVGIGHSTRDSSSEPRIEVSRYYVGIGHSTRDGWGFIDYCSAPRSTFETAFDTDTVFVSEAKARQRQAELYLQAAVAMTKAAAAWNGTP